MADAAAIAAFENDKHAMDKYSRQVGEYGVAAMAKLVQMKVLVIGAKGIGIEAAKNLILAGVGQVTLYDEDSVRLVDLGTNFYLTPEMVNSKQSIAESCLASLKSLNPLVKVDVLVGRLTNKVVKKYSVVLDTNLSMTEAIICDRECLKYNAKFIRAKVHGVFGYMFTDFGKNFTVLDKTGEQVVNRVIDKITFDEEKNELVIRLLETNPLFFDGHVNYVKFEEIEGGMGDILNNLKEPLMAKANMVKRGSGTGEHEEEDLFSIRVSLGEKVKIPSNVKYEGGGTMLQVKNPVKLDFISLERSLVNPTNKQADEMAKIIDFSKMNRQASYHLAICALWKYEEKHKQIPVANDRGAVEEILQLAKEYNLKMRESNDSFSVSDADLDIEVIEMIARFAECNFQPLGCFFGGLVAQEVVKFTGKYTPSQNWLYMDCFEVLPEKMVLTFKDEPNISERQRKCILSEQDLFEVTDADRAPIGSRYDDMIKIFGLPMHNKLTKSSTFMVGCGALGCELLKNFALLGFACDASKQGLITVTDNDTIEISNLSRQFLFREENVGQPKSVAAKASVTKMNPSLNVKAMETLVTPSSEDVFNYKFWDGLSFVTNALDNIQARLYVDSQCVYYAKPLLESGTLGVKCNSQVIIPYLTQSYSDGPTSETGAAIPMCTLRNFPTIIEHCIEWARASFTDQFETVSTKAANFTSDPKTFLKDLRAKTFDLGSKPQILSAISTELEPTEKVYKMLLTAKDPATCFETCVGEAYLLYHRLFRDRILSLITAHPENDLDEDGKPFWNKKKRFPHVEHFDCDNQTHLTFVLSTANILSLTYGVVKSQKDFVTKLEIVKEITQKLTPPVPKLEKVDMSEEDDDVPKEKNDDNDLSDALIEKFEKLIKGMEGLAAAKDFVKIKIEATSFEKDDDSNFHIDYITATSNLRASNYRIKPVTRHKAKMIAGRIIPALATTTAAVTGLVMIEMLKLLQPGKVMDAFRDTSNNLGTNNYYILPPSEPSKAKDELDVITLQNVVCLPPKFTKWDKMIIGEHADMTLHQFLKAFNVYCKARFNNDVKIKSLMHQNANLKEKKGFCKTIYDVDSDGEVNFESDSQTNDKLNQSLLRMVVDTYGEEVLAPTFVKFDCSCAGEVDGEVQEYKVPDLLFRFA